MHQQYGHINGMRTRHERMLVLKRQLPLRYRRLRQQGLYFFLGRERRCRLRFGLLLQCPGNVDHRCSCNLGNARNHGDARDHGERKPHRSRHDIVNGGSE